jgi:hypothetical protein
MFMRFGGVKKIVGGTLFGTTTSVVFPEIKPPGKI